MAELTQTLIDKFSSLDARIGALTREVDAVTVQGQPQYGKDYAFTEAKRAAAELAALKQGVIDFAAPLS